MTSSIRLVIQPKDLVPTLEDLIDISPSRTTSVPIQMLRKRIEDAGGVRSLVTVIERELSSGGGWKHYLTEDRDLSLTVSQRTNQITILQIEGDALYLYEETVFAPIVAKVFPRLLNKADFARQQMLA